MREKITYNVCHGGEEMPMGCTTNIWVSCIYVSICKVDYMMANTFMYVNVTLNYYKPTRSCVPYTWGCNCCRALIVRANLHHGPTSTVRFLQKDIYKAHGPLTSCKPNVDQEEWPCTGQKVNVLIFFIHAQKSTFEENKSSLSILLSSLVFIFSSPKKIS